MSWILTITGMVKCQNEAVGKSMDVGKGGHSEHREV
jgi:hypothetical protein